MAAKEVGSPGLMVFEPDQNHPSCWRVRSTRASNADLGSGVNSTVLSAQPPTALVASPKPPRDTLIHSDGE